MSRSTVTRPSQTVHVTEQNRSKDKQGHGPHGSAEEGIDEKEGMRKRKEAMRGRLELEKARQRRVETGKKEDDGGKKSRTMDDTP